MSYIDSRVASCFIPILLWAVLVATPPARAETDAPESIAHELVDEARLWRGLVSIVGGEPGGRVGLTLAKSGDFVVHVIEPDAETATTLQEQVDQGGLYGRSLIVESAPLDPLPYAGNSIDLLICLDLTTKHDQLSPGEIARVLRPEGTALLGDLSNQGSHEEWFRTGFGVDPEPVQTDAGVFLKFTKPPMEGTDNWSHWEHGPDNNPVSLDQNTKPPFMTQFLGSPYYIAMPAITTAAGGRTFIAMGHIAHHEREEEWLNTLVARNGYNGVELWRKKLPDGYMVHRSAFIATDDVFYMIDPNGNGVLMVDPETGDEIGRIRPRGERGEWKWIALQDGLLYGLIGREKDPAETTIVRSEDHHWSWDELSRGYYEKRVPWGFGETLLAYDLADREVRWKIETEQQIDSRAIAIGGGKVFYYGPDLHIGALDAKSGLRVWTQEDAEITKLIEEQGRGLTSTPGFKSACYLVYSPKALYFQAQTRMNVTAISPQDGSFLWRRKKTTNNPNTVYVDDLLYVGIGEEGSTHRVDPLTGETLRDMEFGKRSCARLTATPYSMFCRAQPEGTVFYDRIADVIRYNGAFRPACNDGVIGANGLLYIGPWLCDCNLSLMGSAALASAGDFNFDFSPEGRLTRGPAYDRVLPEGRDDPSDWSTYRGNIQRSGTTPVWIQGQVDVLWESAPESEFEPTAPVAAGGFFYYAGDDGKVRCLNAFTGEPVWMFRTAGPIKAAPMVWEGRVYVGSGDEHVYCLDAATGNLIWKHHAAPAARRMMVYGSLSSTWPVNTGVLVHEGTAYFAAGIIDYDGTYVQAVDARTGEIRWVNDDCGHLDPDIRKGVSAQGFLTISDGKLWMAGGNVVTPAGFDLKTGELFSREPGNGTPAVNRGEEIGVYNNRYLIQGGRLQYSAAKNVVDPGYFAGYDPAGESGPGPERKLCQGKIAPVWDDSGMYFTNGRNLPPTFCAAEDLEAYLLSGKKSDAPVPKWTATQMNGTDTVTLALAGDVLLAVNESPMPRSLSKSWSLSGVDPESGKVLWKTGLSRPALPGAIAVDREGRIAVVHEGGGITAFGGDKVLSAYVDYLVKQMQVGPDGKERVTRLLNESLLKIHTEGARKLIVATMRDNGIVVGREAKENGAVIDWSLAGPFPFDEENRFEKTFFEVDPVDLTKAIPWENQKFSWREYMTIERSGMVNLAEIYGRLDNSAVFAYAEIDLPEDREIALSVGSNDGYLLWFNGEEAGRFEAGRSYGPDQDLLPVKGKKGKNRILIKVTNIGSNWAFGVRVLDPNERPLNLAGL